VVDEIRRRPESRPMIRKPLIASMILAVFWFFYDFQGKIPGGRVVVIEDAAQKNIITIRKSTDQGDVHALALYVFGEIDGTAEMVLADEKGWAYSYRIGPGRVALKAGGNWHDGKCAIHYDPRDVRSGDLAFRYRFRASKKDGI
jgi:hypothetical protein